MREIGLTKGKVALVDDEDYPKLAQRKWYALHYNQHDPGGGQFYAARMSPRPNRKVIHMHSEIMSKLGIDHINGDGLDNRRSNLRVATQSQNNANSRLDTRSKSGVKGVCLEKSSGKWYAHMGLNGRHIHIGRFVNKADAIAARLEVAKTHFGEFARA